MEEPSADDDRRIVQEIAGRFDAPSYIRRARLLESSWSDALARAAQLRSQQLQIVRLRLGQLRALAGDWARLDALLPIREDCDFLRHLHEELQPQLRMPLEVTTSPRVLRAALRELVEAMTAFNQRWPKLLAKIDLKPVNAAREAYNRYYVLEKECAVGSADLARIGFQRQAPATVDDLAASFPLLPLPQLR